MITIPPNYKIPKDTKVGDTFDEVVTLRLDKPDYATPVAIGGVDIPEPDKEESDEGDMADMPMAAVVMKRAAKGGK